MTGISVRELSDELTWGSIVEGVSWSALEDAEVHAELKGLFEIRGFILFTGCEPTGQMQVAISNVFGPLKAHPTSRADRDAVPGVIDMHYLPLPEGDDTGKVLLNGKKLARYSPWHFDHCYNNELNRGGVLRALIDTPAGGRTGFVDGIELYRQLSPALRQRIERLSVIYTLDVRLSEQKFGKPAGFQAFQELPEVLANAREAAKLPRAIHPAVWTRSTGEKVLHVGPWMAVGLENHEDPEGDSLLEAVCQEINTMAHAYWHRWHPTDMVLWDNWRMLHAVEGIDPKYERRTQRTTIKGDYGLGYFEGGQKVGEVTREVRA
jgi:taurine dioxygenase